MVKKHINHITRIASVFMAGLLAIAGCSSISCVSSIQKREISRGDREDIVKLRQEKNCIDTILRGYSGKRTRLSDLISYDNVELKNIDDIDYSDTGKIPLPGDFQGLLEFEIIPQKYRNKEEF